MTDKELWAEFCLKKNIDIKDTFSLQIKCTDKNNKITKYNFDTKLTKIYDNNLF